MYVEYFNEIEKNKKNDALLENALSVINGLSENIKLRLEIAFYSLFCL